MSQEMRPEERARRQMMDEEWSALCRSNPIVREVVREGGSERLCCIVLAQELERMKEKVCQLKAIAPFKIRLPDGKMMFWRCPDELVPERG